MKYIVVIVSFLLAPVASAIEPAKMALIRDVFEITGAQSTLESTRVENVAQTKALIISNVGAKANDPLMKRVIEKAISKYDAYTQESMGWDRWEPELAAVYDELFTEADLKSLITFYKTSAGRSMIKAAPALASKMQKRMFDQAKDRQARMDSILRQAVNEVRAEEAMQ